MSHCAAIFLTLLLFLLAGIFPANAMLNRTATEVNSLLTAHSALSTSPHEVNQAEQTKTYHYDQVGSTILRTDDGGEVIGKAEYSAYGICFWKQGDMDTSFQYNGQAGIQTDSNGLLHMRARYYSPYLMRFLNADPIGFSGGSNWFAYADGNPISMSDPFGLCAVDCRTGQSVQYHSDPIPPQLSLSKQIHQAASTVGMIPVIGELADLLNVGMYLGEGNYDQVKYSLTAAIPLAGWLAGARNIARYSDETAELVAKTTIPSAGGVIRQFEQQGAQTYYRVFSGDATTGQWLTAVPPKSSAWAQEALALPRNNSASLIQEVIVPNGTMLERSRAIPMPDWGRMRGGAEQFKLLERIPDANFGPGVLLR